MSIVHSLNSQIFKYLLGCDWLKHQPVMVSECPTVSWVAWVPFPPDVQRKSYSIIGWLITAGGLLVMSYSAAWHSEGVISLPTV